MTTPQAVESGAHLGGMTPNAVTSAFRLLTDLAVVNGQSVGTVVRINTALQTTLDIHTLIKLLARSFHALFRSTVSATATRRTISISKAPRRPAGIAAATASSSRKTLSAS